MPIAIKINPKDNVVVALHPIAKGTAVPVDNTTVTAIEDIPQGHKMAIAPIKGGEKRHQIRLSLSATPRRTPCPAPGCTPKHPHEPLR